MFNTTAFPLSFWLLPYVNILPLSTYVLITPRSEKLKITYSMISSLPDADIDTPPCHSQLLLVSSRLPLLNTKHPLRFR